MRLRGVKRHNWGERKCGDVVFPGRCAGKHFRDSFDLRRMSDEEKLRRSTRNKERVDYKQMADGKEQPTNRDKEEEEDELDLNGQDRQVTAGEEQGETEDDSEKLGEAAGGVDREGEEKEEDDELMAKTKQVEERLREVQKNIDKARKLRELEQKQDQLKQLEKQLKEINKKNRRRSSSDSTESTGSETEETEEERKQSRKSKKNKKKHKSKKNRRSRRVSTSDSSSSSSTDTSSSDEEILRLKRKQKKKKVTEENKRKSKSKINEIRTLWAHEEIVEDIGGREIRFNDLTFRQYIAGELEIITEASIGADEREARLRLMKKMAYLLGGYEWRQIREIYGYIATRIERGLLSWESRMGEEIQWALQKKVGATQNEGKKISKNIQSRIPGGVERIWYCPSYQRANCNKASGHEETVNGRKVNVQHICARCYTRDKKREEHPESQCTA